MLDCRSSLQPADPIRTPRFWCCLPWQLHPKVSQDSRSSSNPTLSWVGLNPGRSWIRQVSCQLVTLYTDPNWQLRRALLKLAYFFSVDSFLWWVRLFSSVFRGFGFEISDFAWFLHDFGTWNSILNGICSILDWNFCFCMVFAWFWNLKFHFERYLQHFGLKLLFHIVFAWLGVWSQFRTAFAAFWNETCGFAWHL